MKILLTTPYIKENYFNICYNYTEFGVVATQISKRYASNLVVHDNTVGDYYPCEADIIVIWTRFETIGEFINLYRDLKTVSPFAPIIVYGSPVILAKKCFENYADYTVTDQNWSRGVTTCIDSILRKNSCQDCILTGVGEIVFPDVKLLPISRYFDIYKITENKISGFHYTNELALELSVGCNRHCPFCIVPVTRGKQKWRNMTDVANYISQSIVAYPFNFISVFSANFTDPSGIGMEFCKFIEKLDIPWKCVSNVDTASNEFISAMGRSGCVRIGFGVETLNESAQRSIGKYINKEELLQVTEKCQKAGILPMAFLMLGIPGETRDSFDESLRFFLAHGIMVRVTAYTPYHKMKVSHIEELASYNRMGRQFYEMDNMDFQLAISDIDEYVRRYL